MNKIQKYLVSLIPIVLLAVIALIFSFVIYGDKVFSSIENTSIILAALGYGLLIQVTFLNDCEIHLIWRILSWIGYIAFAAYCCLGGAGFISRASNSGLSELQCHLFVGLGIGGALLIIYGFICPAIGLGEDNEIMFRLVAPIVILFVGTFAGGYLRYFGNSFLNTLSLILLIAPPVIIIALLILFIKASMLDTDYSSWESNRGGSRGNNHNSSGGNSSTRDVNEASICNALIGLTASDTMGCTVTLTITSATISGDGIMYDYEETVQHAAYGTENYPSAHYHAERKLKQKIDEKLRNLR